METIDIKLFERLDEESQVNKPLTMAVDELLVMRGREREECVEVGDYTTIYRIIRVTDVGFEAKPEVVQVVK